eukprot:gene11596-24394_t
MPLGKEEVERLIEAQLKESKNGAKSKKEKKQRSEVPTLKLPPGLGGSDDEDDGKKKKKGGKDEGRGEKGEGKGDMMR